MNLRDRLAVGLIITVLVCAIGFMLKDILLPFVAGLVVAYLLHPLARKLVKYKIPPALAALLATFLFITIFVLSISWLAPLFYGQVKMLSQRAANYNSASIPLVNELLVWVHKNMPHLQQQAEANISNILNNLLGIITTLLSKLLSSGMFVINILSLLLIAPFVTYHTLKDWDKIASNIQKFIPKNYKEDFNEIIKSINKALVGYLRGQTYVSSIMAIYYASSLTFIGLDSGFALGILTGILTFIPYVGALIAFLLCLLNTLVLYGDAYHMSLLLIVFFIGSMIETNILSPKLIGDNVGLHPVWIMFGLLACASVLNFLGILIAVPLTAMFGVFIRFSLKKYVIATKLH